jgi:hypothetical protein
MKKISNYHQLVWDYDLTAHDFEAILAGQKTIGWFNQAWAMGRVLENLPYYQAISLVPLSFLAQKWLLVKPRLFADSLKKGYEFVLREYALSATE